MRKSCSVIIPTKDKLSRLYLTLKCLESQITAVDQVVVVFDGCNKETIAGFKKFEFTFHIDVVISDKNVGRASARNLGISKATGEVIIFLDDDRLTERDFIAKHVAYHENEVCVVLGERMDLKYTEEEVLQLIKEKSITSIINKIRDSAHKEFYYNIKKFFLKNPLHPLRYIAFITGNVSIDALLLHHIGGFDESFKGWGYEDTELGYRLVQHQVKFISDCSIVCYHLLHSHIRGQKSKEEIENLGYLRKKFPDDKVLQRVIHLYLLKATFRL